MLEKIFDSAGSNVFRDELQEVHSGAHHNTNLFDLDEGPGGERVDLATGKSIDNSTELGTEHLSLVNQTDLENEIPSLVGIDDTDAAAKWLRENS